MIEAAVNVVGSKGYAATSVGDIIKAAGVSRTTFYEQFHDKESCFIGAYDEGARRHLEHVGATAKAVAGSMARLQAGVRACLQVLAEEPAYARTALVEALAAGPAVASTRDWIHARYAEMLGKWHAEARAENQLVPAVPGELFDCAIGGVADFLGAMVREGQTEHLPRLAPVIVTFLLNATAVPAGRDLAAALAASRARRG